MLENVKAAIFDLDGTLVDSMWVWEKVDIEYLRDRNLPFPSNLKSCIEHLSFEETARYFKETFHIQDSLEEIQEEWNNMAYDQYLNNVKLKPGVKAFLTLLKSKGIKIGLATSNCHLLLETALKANGIHEYFDSITVTSEVKRGKNFPDVYLLAAERLQVDPKDCVVFEDILPAVLGAKAAGMKVVGVYDNASRHQKEEILSEADRFIIEFHELLEAM